MGPGTQDEPDASHASWEPGRLSEGTTEDPAAGPHEEEDPAADAALAVTAYTVACSGLDALRFLWAAFGGPSCVLLHRARSWIAHLHLPAYLSYRLKGR